MSQMISIVGRSQSGKTTLIEKLIPVLKGRGYRVGTIKHSHHIFDFDKTGKDSWRHKDAGAETVIVASPGKIAMVKNDYRGSLDDLKKFFDDLDLVITEGYKKENKPKIEVVRSARHADALLKADKHLVAVVSDVDLKLEVPIFGLEDIDRLADFIEEKYLLWAIKKNQIYITELQAMMDNGCRCVMFYFIQRMDAAVFKPADHIDPKYGENLRIAVKSGLEILAYDVSIDLNGIKLNQKIPYEL